MIVQFTSTILLAQLLFVSEINHLMISLKL